MLERTTVSSTSKVTDVPEAVEVIPSPPDNVSVSVPRLTVSEPESPATVNAVEIVEVVISTITPCLSTVIFGIAVVEPYVVDPEILVIFEVNSE